MQTETAEEASMPTVHDVMALTASGMRRRQPRMLAIRAARAWDPAAGVIAGPLTVWVSLTEGTIERIDRGRSDHPADHELIDLGDAATLMPGMVDCHVHLCWDPFSD